MAADLVVAPKTIHTFVHDLESAFYVVLWLSIKYLGNSWSDRERAMAMIDLFNPHSFDDVGSSSKLNWMTNAIKLLNAFDVLNNRVLTNVLRSLAEIFQARCRILNSGGEPKDRPFFSSQETEPPTVGRNDFHSLDDYEAVIKIFNLSLDVGFLATLKEEWPVGDSAEVQDIAILKESLYSSYYKRSKSCVGKEGSSQKRIRTK